MTFVNRLLALAVGLALVLLAILVIGEVTVALLGRPPWLVDRAAIDATLTALPWADRGILLTGLLMVVAGLVLLALELRRRRPTVLALREERERRVADLERRSLENRLAAVAGRDPDVAAATARIGRKRAVLALRTVRDSSHRDVSQRVLNDAAMELQTLELLRPLRLKVETMPGRERAR